MEKSRSQCDFSTVRVLVPVLHSHFIGCSITSKGIFEERHAGIEILSLSSLDVKSGSELPTFTSVYQALMRGASF